MSEELSRANREGEEDFLNSAMSFFRWLREEFPKAIDPEFRLSSEEIATLDEEGRELFTVVQKRDAEKAKKLMNGCEQLVLGKLRTNPRIQFLSTVQAFLERNKDNLTPDRVRFLEHISLADLEL